LRVQLASICYYLSTHLRYSYRFSTSYVFSFSLLLAPSSTLFPYTTLFRSHIIPNFVDSCGFSPITVEKVDQIPFLTWYQNHPPLDRKSTRLNSSHVSISYAVFCLKKKTLREPALPERCVSPAQEHTSMLLS